MNPELRNRLGEVEEVYAQTASVLWDGGLATIAIRLEYLEGIEK